MTTRTISPGSNWSGLYSRFSFNPQKQQIALLKEVAKPVLDDEFAWLQDAILTSLRSAVTDIAGQGCIGDGLLITADGSSNNFGFSAGLFYLDGLRVENPVAARYSEQPGASPLTTPSSARTDCAYLDLWLDEVGPDVDPSMVDPTIAQETSRRLAIFWRVRVAEGSASAPMDFIDAFGLAHRTAALALINRDAGVAAITAAMLSDVRDLFGSTAVLAGSGDGFAVGDTKNTLRLDDQPGFYSPNGFFVSRADYPELSALLMAGTLPLVNEENWAADGAMRGCFSRADGSQYWRLPFMLGDFERVANPGNTGRDPNRAVGSGQDSQNLAHDHGNLPTGEFFANNGPGSVLGFSSSGDGAGAQGQRPAGGLSGGSEARPANVAVRKLIKLHSARMVPASAPFQSLDGGAGAGGSGNGFDAATPSNGALSNSNRTFTSNSSSSPGQVKGFAVPATTKNQVEVELATIISSGSGAATVIFTTSDNQNGISYAQSGALTAIGANLSTGTAPPLASGSVVGLRVNHPTRAFELLNGTLVVATGTFGGTGTLSLLVSVGTKASVGNVVNLYTGAPRTALAPGYLTWDARSVTDFSPNDFSFTPRTGAAPNTSYISNTVTISGITAGCPIDFVPDNGFADDGYSINGGPYTTASGTIDPGNTLRMRCRSVGGGGSAEPNAPAVIVGDLQREFRITTA